MAATYLTALRRVLPEGPYHLAGWSVGGVIAWEMAQQLRAAGEEVGLLALFDTLAPGAAGEEEPDAAVLLAGLARDLAGLAGREIGIPIDRLREQGPEAGLEEILRLARQAGALPAGFGDGQAERLWRVYRANFRAVRAYEPRPFDGRLALFAARSNPFLVSLGPALGWQRLAGAAWTPRVLETDHYSLLRSPAVAQLSERVREYLG
jgi:thioesterase domain-containing protein